MFDDMASRIESILEENFIYKDKQPKVAFSINTPLKPEEEERSFRLSKIEVYNSFFFREN